MEKDSALYQLIDTRMNGVMNGIVSGAGEYQAILPVLLEPCPLVIRRDRYLLKKTGEPASSSSPRVPGFKFKSHSKRSS